MNWSHYQQAVFDWIEQGTGSAIVEAVAGSGKTTTIVEASKRMHGRILLAAFNRRMAEELKSRVVGKGNCTAGTFHSVGLRAYRKVYPYVRVEEKKVPLLIDELEEKSPTVVIPRTFVSKLVGLAKQCGVGVICPIEDDTIWRELVEHFDLEEFLPDEDDEQKREENIEGGIRWARRFLEMSNEQDGMVDFNDMLYLPLLFRLSLDKYEWILVDEAQDTNPVRLLLTAECLSPKGRVIAVGDPHQAIYGFSGADALALEHIKERFDCQRFPLSVSYRCPRAVVRHARQWVSHIEPFDGAGEGEVRTITLRDLLKEEPAKGDAILCRVNKPLVRLCFALIRRGIPARIEGREIGQGLITLTRKWKVKSLEALRRYVVLYEEREVQYAMKRGREAKAAEVRDKVDTLLVLIERAQELGKDVEGLRGLIEEMFEDGVSGRGLLTLCSVHKAKGLEWRRVFLLGRRSLMPSKYAKQDWQKGQENNLIYVAVTRAKERLIEVEGVEEMEAVVGEWKEPVPVLGAVNIVKEHVLFTPGSLEATKELTEEEWAKGEKGDKKAWQ